VIKTNNESNGNRASPFAAVAEDTSSSISSFHSTSDTSLAGSLLESPTKTEPNESFRDSSSSAMITNDNDILGSDNTETVTMTLEDITAFAQPMADSIY
jgi:hypothetical protein